MHVLVLNQYFHPDRSSTSQILTELCEDLAEHHRVTVVAGRPSYDPVEARPTRGLVTAERHGNVNILRTWSTSFSRSSMAGRLTNYTTYLASCLAGALKADRPDVVLTMTDPPFVAATALLASRLRRVSFVYICQDVFPEVGVVLGRIRSGVLERSLSWLNRVLRRRAARVVAIGRDMERWLVERGVPPERIAMIPNWADGSLIRPLEGPSSLRRRRGWADRFVVMHSGNVGLSQSLDTLVGAAEALRGEARILFVVIGEGASKATLQDAVRRGGLPNVEFLPYQPKEELADSLGAADVHLVMLRRGLARFIVPSKVYGIMAAGKPFIAAVEPGSEPALIVEEHGCGLRIDPDDPSALAEAIVRIRDRPLAEMGRRARAAFDARYARPTATAAYARLLEAVAANGGA